MNLLRLLTREELISGLEISDTGLRIILLEQVKTRRLPKASAEFKTNIYIKCAQDVPLPAGVVVDGKLKDSAALTGALRELVKKCEYKIRYAVVSLPPDTAYAKVFGFPKTIQGERLEESMKLTIGFQLPVKPEDVYLDWESIGSSKDNEIFLASMPKAEVDKFVGAVEAAGLKPVAIEFYPTSLARAVDTAGKEAVLVKMPTASSTLLAVLYKQYPYFCRVLPKIMFDEAKVAEEERKISDFFESEKKVKPEVLDIKEAKIIYELYNHPAVKQGNGKWLVAAGAALRGLMPRSQDALISLMPVGTEEAYAYQKASAFAGFLSNITLVVSIFFVAIFLGAWLFMVSMQQRINKQIEGLAVIPISTDSAQMEERAKKVNELSAALGGFVGSSPRWNGALEELRSRVAPGIFITSLSLKSPLEPVNLSGVAQNRNQLNMFKRFLDGSQVFAEANIPLTNLGQKENIPFTVTVKLKDPKVVYNR